MYRETPLYRWDGPFFGGVYRLVVKHKAGDDSWEEVVQAVSPQEDGKWYLSQSGDTIDAPDLDAAIRCAEMSYTDSLKAQIAEMQAIVDSFEPKAEGSGFCTGMRFTRA